MFGFCVLQGLFALTVPIPKPKLQTGDCKDEGRKGIDRDQKRDGRKCRSGAPID